MVEPSAETFTQASHPAIDDLIRHLGQVVLAVADLLRQPLFGDGPGSVHLPVVGFGATDRAEFGVADREPARLAVDRALSRLYRDGEWRAIYVKWFGEPDADTIAFFRLSVLPE